MFIAPFTSLCTLIFFLFASCSGLVSIQGEQLITLVKGVLRLLKVDVWFSKDYSNKDVDWVIYARCLWTKWPFTVLKSAQILNHNMLSYPEWIYLISGRYSAFQMNQILYTTLWANHTNSECTMSPPVAEFGFIMNEPIFVQVINVYRKQIRPGVGSEKSGWLNLGQIWRC